MVACGIARLPDCGGRVVLAAPQLKGDVKEDIRASRRRRALIGGVLLLLTACAGTVRRGPPPSTDIDENGFRAAVRELASDDFEGRKPGTPGEDKTVAFLVERFRKLGLKPGNGDSYLQQVPLVEITADRDASLSITGHGGVEALEYAKDMVIWTQREVPQASLQRSELVFVGYGIVAPEFDWNDYANVDAHGKTVMVMVGDPGYGTKDPRVFHGDAETYYGRWTYKVEEAARQGAAGILLIHEPGAAGYGWDVVVNGRTGPQLQAAGLDSSGVPAIDGWVSLAAARALFLRAALDFDGLTAAAARPGFKAIPMGFTADAAVHNTLRQFNSANVIAVLPGTSHKNEVVLYTAHWDHLGRQSASAGGAIFNGAVDNAAGVAGLLMLAQSFARTHAAADRSLGFVAFTAGDAGLLGSRYYVEHPLFPLRLTVAALNLDMPHIGGPTRDVMVFGAGNSELEDYVKEAALLQGREVRPDPIPEQGFYYRSDQFSFASSGVPALYARAGLDDSARGPAFGRQQLNDFLLHRYHQTSDRHSADWDVRGTLDDLRLYYEVGNRLAHSRRFPRFYPNSEFRVSRTQ
jgi:Zn-dependent M28 family amino/carboxypeptidase